MRTFLMAAALVLIGSAQGQEGRKESVAFALGQGGWTVKSIVPVKGKGATVFVGRIVIAEVTTDGYVRGKVAYTGVIRDPRGVKIERSDDVFEQEFEGQLAGTESLTIYFLRGGKRTESVGKFTVQRELGKVVELKGRWGQVDDLVHPMTWSRPTR